MELLISFKITVFATLQIFLLGLCGYILVKKNYMSVDNLKFLTRLAIGLFFPCYIFVKLIQNFNFNSYANWWFFPLLSFFVAFAGLLVGLLFLKMDKNLNKFRKEFISLVTFQNSGYLPLILIVFLLPPARRESMLVEIFLFLLGFNIVIWSIGAFYLAKEKDARFEMRSLFSPPVIAILSALFLIAIGLNKFIPDFLIRPAQMLGDCALPLVIMVVGGNLALINFKIRDHFRYIYYLTIAKLFFLPLVFLILIFLIKPPYEIAFLLLLQSMMPSATSLSVIMRHYDKDDNIVSLGIFWTHVVGLLTMPLFLTLFSTLRFLIYK